MKSNEYEIHKMDDDGGYFIELTKVFASPEESQDYAKHLEIVWG